MGCRATDLRLSSVLRAQREAGKPDFPGFHPLGEVPHRASPFFKTTFFRTMAYIDIQHSVVCPLFPPEARSEVRALELALPSERKGALATRFSAGGS